MVEKPCSDIKIDGNALFRHQKWWKSFVPISKMMEKPCSDIKMIEQPGSDIKNDGAALFRVT